MSKNMRIDWYFLRKDATAASSKQKIKGSKPQHKISKHQKTIVSFFQKDVIAALSKKEAINEKMIDLQESLYDEIIQKNTVKIAFLIREGAKIHDCLNVRKEYPLHLACRNGTTKSVQLLLHLGADVNVTDQHGNTPFSMSLIDWNYMYSVHTEGITKCMIKHIARLNVAGMMVNEKDLSLIRGSTILQGFYDSCMEELERMKTIDAADGFPYYWLFSKTNYQLSLLMRDSNVPKQMKKSILQLWLGAFPIYREEIMVKFGLVRKMSNLVVSIEEELKEVFDEMFGIFPCLVIHKIVEYSLKNFEKDYYVNKLL